MKYYVTTPIYYVNDSPHIGHIYTTLAADVIARFKKLNGFDVYFLTGVDEHGQKVEKAAHLNDLTPQKFCDQVCKRFEDLCDLMNISNSDFIRTTEDRHKEVVKEVWSKLLAQGDIYLGKYSGWYCVRDEAFYSDTELVDGKAPTGASVEWIEEESYFFNLSKWQDKLLEFYDANPDFILPHFRKNEVKNFVLNGLKDLSVSRTSFKWGIKVPCDENHVIYVWLDALFNYYSAINNKNLNYFWPPDLHVIGKDITRFHAIYWPAFLMALGMPLPKTIFAHGWWLVEGSKMSKSEGNVINPLELINEYGLDYVRYFLMREMPFGNDHSYSKKSFVNKINSELCNNIGNLCQRVLMFVFKNLDSTVPYNQVVIDDCILKHAYQLASKMQKLMDKYDIYNAFEEVIKLSSLANEFINDNAPWVLKKSDPEKLNSVLYILLETIRIIGISLNPLIPMSSDKILDSLGIGSEFRTFKYMNKDFSLKSGSLLPQPEVIFPRIT